MTRSEAGRLGLALALAFLSCVLAVPPLAAQAAEVTGKDVLPILQKNCFQCHGADLRMANLDLRTPEAILQGGDSGPALVPGSAEESLIYARVSGQGQPQMPMAPLPALSGHDILVLKKWIDQGASWNAADSARADTQAPGDKANASYDEYVERVITDEMRQWWAFQKPVRHPTPKIADSRWSANPVDAFVRAAMDAKGLTPAPQADRNTLIRRAYLDLTGLLPTPEQVDAFVNDASPRAYEALVERLLASDHYGERWGRFWLDVVRYADSSGFEHDRTLQTAWRYRDYVIKALNEDKPYNQFLIEQIAGDELDEPTDDSLIATAYYRVGPRVRFREKANPHYRYDYMDDMIRTTFQGFMGMSVHCARCHDHKFDPITRMDYYRTVGMFYGHVSYDHLLGPKEEAQEWSRRKKEVLRAIAPLEKAIAEIEAPYKRQEFEERLKRLPEDVQIAVRTPKEARTRGQELLASQFERNLDSGDEDAAGMGIDLGKIVFAASDNVDYRTSALPGGALEFAKKSAAANGRPLAPAGQRQGGFKPSPEDQQKIKALRDQIAALEETVPELPPAIEGVRDGDYRLAPNGPGDNLQPGQYDPAFGKIENTSYVPEPGQKFVVPPVHFTANGMVVEEDIKAPVVEPGFVTVLAKGDEAVARPPDRDDYVSSGRRRALAEWIASDENPLTARVLVNRLWYWHFGKGIVATPGNFGKMGVPPSHPELLDWLATEFIRQGWSIKQMQRLLMNSETYKMASSFYDADNIEKDPTDTFLWRYPVRRLEGETIRDVILSASGQINLEAGGEAFYPAIPDSVREGYQAGRWILTKEGPETWRRSIYSYWKRGMKLPMFEVHDQPDPNVTTEKRNISTVSTQALTLLNSEFTLLQARHLADRVVREAPADLSAQVKRLYRITISRAPSERELAFALKFLNEERELLAIRISASDAVDGVERNAAQAALTNFAHVMLNTNEFLYFN
ncbi:MAG: PSD1 and planctomycete cytochrome C domain-containing protein [Acidobacteria bacterium]|nr:PSD1 and planctomycete cytochrome C domain-containing protein [Acidobacteriota bacterium]MDA1234914.1 PSD1 and planctomycete cytochrome C domain-containing protein [Acidobacteriota bacterium]